MKPPRHHHHVVVNKEIEPLTKDEFQLLIKNSNEIYRLIYYIAASMGLRQSEILWIDVQDIDFLNKILTYRVQKTKNDRITTKKIPSKVFNIIQDYVLKHRLKPSDALFKLRGGRYANNRLSAKTVSKRTKEKFLALGIGCPRAERNVSSKANPIRKASLHNKNFHSLRHMYGTMVFDITESMDITANSLRHSKGNLNTVRYHYVKLHNLSREETIQEELVGRLEEVIY